MARVLYVEDEALLALATADSLKESGLPRAHTRRSDTSHRWSS